MLVGESVSHLLVGERKTGCGGKEPGPEPEEAEEGLDGLLDDLRVLRRHLERRGGGVRVRVRGRQPRRADLLLGGLQQQRRGGVLREHGRGLD